MVRKNWATADIFLDMNLYFYGYQCIISLIIDIFFFWKVLCQNRTKTWSLAAVATPISLAKPGSRVVG